ncbi:MAG: bacteriohemerythrin [Thermoguttaceae bacterium]|nr:bacteriohemerythrin [Thermoguttaceae bacterium]MDW8038217.1 bacteriohemerythrin [Thermoguttaceae bacterium]
MPIVWDDSLRTGVLLVDGQHQELFRQINSLHEAMLQGKGREEVAKLIQFLDSYTKKHFAEEERLMADRKCPVAEANKLAHRQLLERLEQLKTQFAEQKTGTTVTMEIYRLMSDWLVRHIKAIDLKLRETEPALSMAGQQS